MGEQVWQYISHGIEWKKHKYVAKVEIKPKKYRYFYTKSSYEAYLAKEKKLKEQQVSYESKSKSNVLSDFLSKFLFKSNSAKVLKSNRLSNVKKYIFLLDKKRLLAASSSFHFLHLKTHHCTYFLKNYLFPYLSNQYNRQSLFSC